QVFDDELRVAERRLEASLSSKLRDAEATSRAGEALHRLEESHLAAIAKIDGDRARAIADADAGRLGAVQAELAGGLHSPALGQPPPRRPDGGLCERAAETMPRAPPRGGKPPPELLRNVLAATPLERTSRDMAPRAEPPPLDEGAARSKPGAPPAKPSK